MNSLSNVNVGNALPTVNTNNSNAALGGHMAHSLNNVNIANKNLPSATLGGNVAHPMNKSK